jgi:small-conductance mechanosensitive channel
MQLPDFSVSRLLSATTVAGALLLAVIVLGASLVLATIVRRAARRVEGHLTDVTGLRFAAALAQVLIYVAAFILYAYLIPQLRALGTALLAGVSVISLILGLAAQNTLGNLISGLSIVLYRSVSVGDTVQLNTPKGSVTATIRSLSLGYTMLRDADEAEIIVPNSVMANNVVVRLSRNDTQT